MSAESILIKAFEFNAAGRYLEALTLFEDGIRALLDRCKAETDPIKKRHYQTKIGEYIESAEKVKKKIEARSTRGEVIDMIQIAEGATGHSYKQLFGKYLDENVREIKIDEPYLREHHQFMNFIMFLELAIKQCSKLKYIKLVTSADPKSPADQQKALDEIKESLGKKGINLSIEMANIHDREILLDNGIIIKIGRGLHIYKPLSPKYSLGINDFDFRQCKETKVDISKCPQGGC